MDSTGASYVGFSVDADTQLGFQKIGTTDPTVSFNHDDWFISSAYSGRGRRVIDTTGASVIRAQLVAGNNISFTKRMILPAYSVVPYAYAADGVTPIAARFWVDGVYYRDYAKSGDLTTFTNSKNGDNPNSWTAASGSPNDKTDLIDVYTHVRTSGIDPQKDSVWFFAGVSTLGTNGARYYDIEVYRENFSYNATTGKFTSGGTDGGHSLWTFDADGNVTQTGDIIISVTYQSGAPEIDFRIWVSNSTYANVRPKNFRFGNKFDGNGTSGYAQILSTAGANNWGSGLANYTTNSARDTTYSTPWGTMNTSGQWSERYDRLQFIEVALNFSRFGMNPFQYVQSYCKSPYSAIIVKSRQSPSFSANLSDFVVPSQFTVKDLIPYTVKTDTVTCAKPIGIVNINASARNYYRWMTLTGDTVKRDSDSPIFTAPKSGTYVIEATNFLTCAPMKKDTITVYVDSTAPTAIAVLGHGKPFYFLNGSGSVTGTSFGTSSLSYSWVGPTTSTGAPFTSNLEDPKIADVKDSIVSGLYTLTVTQGRNGCKASSTFFVDITVLSSNAITLQAKLANGKAKLDWNTPDRTQAPTFEIERSSNGIHFVKIGHVNGTVGTKQYSFIDNDLVNGQVQYRIKSSNIGSAPTYSNIVALQAGNIEKIVMARQTSTNRLTVQLGKAVTDKDVQIKVMTVDGRLLLKNTYPGQQARSRNASINLSLPASTANQPVIVAIYQDSHLLEARKL
jgi:hypothetical protein